MVSTLTLFAALLVSGQQPAIDTVCEQVAPVHAEGQWMRSANRTQAVLVIRGLQVHVREKHVARAELQTWQKANSPLVKELGKASDVFVFAYGQNAPIDAVVNQSKLCERVKQIRKLGYADVVLVGHSAGGLVARHFVEDHPNVGVTKVVQIATPNGGASLASLGVLTAPKSQKPFLECLTVDNRRKCLEERAGKVIPKNVHFVCLVAKLKVDPGSDGVVSCVHQWSPDLQAQGIPAVCVTGSHAEVVRSAKLAETVARLVGERHDRWPVERVEKAKKEILRK
ncbi:MAG TPA: hypothetical protein VFE62_22380 [Gemmataceae bacterium]|nr:hypothetical protein [Gemmataceae bacterium]